ncbi:MAG TPA: ABC transporter permease [Acidimicrobiales bacterium]
MTRQLARVVAYRFRVTFARRRGDYLALVLLVGLLGGVAMASIAAGRRTQSAFPAFAASTNPSTVTMSVYGNAAGASGYSAALGDAIARLPQVKHVESWVGAGVATLKPDGAPDMQSSLNPVGSVDGLFFDEDRATAVQGRMADPGREDEFVTTALGAQLLGAHVGQVIPTGLYGPDQFAQPGFGTASVPPLRRIDMTLVGIVEFNSEVIEDDVDRVPTNVLYTPALTRSLLADGAVQGTWYAMQLVHGDRDVAAVEQALLGVIPPDEVPNFRVTSITDAKVERAIRPESIALGAFGAIAALAALAIAGQAVNRQVRAADPDLEVLRALGASPGTTLVDGAVGVFAAIVIGALLAVAMAVALSPLAPLGPVRRVYPSPGIAADWTVFATGFVVLVGGLGAVAAVVAHRFGARRAAESSVSSPARGSHVATMAASAGMPAPAVVGLRFALEPGQGRTAVPVRSALIGSILAVAVVASTLTFGAGLRTLVAKPSLYGWNWTLGLSSIYGVPPPALQLLDRDPVVDGYASYQDSHAQLDGQDVPVLLGPINAKVAPPILSGHGLTADNQIVLGAATLASLHKQVGDSLVGSFGTPANAPFYVAPTRVTIVGTATLPAVVGSGSFADHTTMGSGAILSNAFIGQQANPDPILGGPPLVFVRMRGGVSQDAAQTDLQRVADAGNSAFAADPNAAGAEVDVLPVQHPAEIVNYAATGSTPVVLAAGLAVGAVAALGLTLYSSVRRRRRDLALLKTLGFTKRQLGVAIACQALVAGIVGVAIGLPLGIAAGRWLWTLFARDIYAVPQPVVPASLFLVAVGTLGLVLIVAALPGRVAARTPAALVLRSE